NAAGTSEKLTHTVDFKGVDNVIYEKTHGFFHRDPNKPHFAQPLGDHIVSDGGTIAITAEMAPSSTPLEVQWLRDKKPLSGPKIKAFYDKNLYYLTVSKADINDEGQYTCRAMNAFGRVESNANVHMTMASGKSEVPPLFLSRPDTEMKIAINDPFSFAFRFKGNQHLGELVQRSGVDPNRKSKGNGKC
uniref:Ig-like domain-containing protein n=1 Tax=Megaselia scalaris TaxID=36166 RepID=T1GH44_MEGSC